MLSLYVHWPFCLSKCIYCDFGSQVISKEMSSNSLFQEEYFSCCKKQLIYFEIKEKNSFVKDEYNFYINLNELGNINRFFNQFSDCKGSI